MPKKKRQYKIIRVSLSTYNKIKKIADKKGKTLLATLEQIV